MNREQAIKEIIEVVKNEPNILIISSTGLISRQLFQLHDSPQNFYMVGSMGLASSIALGLASVIKDKKILILEGDGSLLMNLNSIASIGYYSPQNIIHIVLDNESYDSSGGEPTITKIINLDKVAEAVGYKFVKKVSSLFEIHSTLDEAMSKEGPVFILIKIEKGGERNLPRILNLEEVKSRFMEFIKR
jgi:thiamine pyrophosphate-dependent acetolactate synthase large subunit-like protein